MYHVWVINEKTGKEVRMTRTPVNHDEGCTLLKALTNYPWRRKLLRYA